jgi:hypothetical protein
LVLERDCAAFLVWGFVEGSALGIIFDIVWK